MMKSQPTKKSTVTSADSGLRLDQWLTQQYPDHSRSFWQKHIKSANIRVNGKKAAASHTLKENDTIAVPPKKAAKVTALKDPGIDLVIVFEDTNYAVIDKPAGLVVHPGAGHKGETLADALRYRFKENLSGTESDRPGIVHRLDKDTSGLLVVAKNDKAHRFLAEQFESKTIHKKYIALVEGHLFPDQGSIEAPLNRNLHQRQKITVTSRPGSRYALTHYAVTKRFDTPFPCSLLDVQIETGRTHQIRVHFEAIGHPVLGDQVYGKNVGQSLEAHGLHRQFLHAAELTFTSPTTQKKVTYKSALPSDLKETLKALK